MKKTKKRESKGYLPYILVVGLVAIVAVVTIGIHEAQTNYEPVYDEEGNVVGQAYSRGWWDAFWSFASESMSSVGVGGGPGGGAGGSGCYCRTRDPDKEEQFGKTCNSMKSKNNCEASKFRNVKICEWVC
ncbi:MAG: hypothetical protein PHT54_01595 [Candidatus Nanoarchaeia archaeon]|nr:hypothetical protein [Candidatus Nanoarchaeia archaeon]